MQATISIKKNNGSDEVKIYGLRGSFEVKSQRYILEDGNSTSYLALNSNLSNGIYTHNIFYHLYQIHHNKDVYIPSLIFDFLKHKTTIFLKS
jgi:hypothetical protein